jgi:3-oxoacyl-[acyl-carrier protein] reductase
MIGSRSRLERRVVLVTGGSRGIGNAIVAGALARKASVVYCSRQGGVGSAAEVAAPESGGRLLALMADVSREEDVERLFEKTIEVFGRVDIVINNAAIEHASLFVNLEVGDWEKLIAVNMTGTFLVCRRAIRQFIEQGSGGRIVNVGSISQEGAPSNAGYAMSKAGLVGLTHSIAARYADQGITAALVAPGFVETELTAGMSARDRQSLVDSCPLKRAATPAEVAAAVLFLAQIRGEGSAANILRVTGGLMETPQ